MRIYDRLTPHCEAATKYQTIALVRVTKTAKGRKREIVRETRYRCIHDR